MLWPAAHLLSHVDHSIERVGDDNHIGIGRVLYQVRDYCTDDFGVGMEQVIATHPRLAGHTSRDHYNIGIRRIGIVIRPHQAAVKVLQRGTLSQIKGFALWHTLNNIDQDHITQFLRRSPVGSCGADVSCSYDRNFGSQPLVLLLWNISLFCSLSPWERARVRGL